MAKKILVAAGVFTSAVMQAQEGLFMVRVRAVELQFENGQKDALPGPIEAENRWIP